MNRARVLAAAVAVVVLAPLNPARADEPTPGTPEWLQRDLANQEFATRRLQDQYTNPAFGQAGFFGIVSNYPNNVADQLAHPDRPMATLGQWIPGGDVGDPLRLHWHDERKRGIRSDVEYENRYGARLTGHVWAPKVPFTDPVTGQVSNGPFPAVVITTGSIQAPEEFYWWAAQGLAEAGYVVMTYDVQGQGESETLPGGVSGASGQCEFAPPTNQNWQPCPGVPSQNLANFEEGTEDALDFLLSSDNPLRGLIDDTRLGLAGHSLGATAVTRVGNRDPRIDAVVGWDNINNCATVTDCVAPRVPTMGQNAEYFLNPQPTLSAPDPLAKAATFSRFAAAGIDTMQVALRGSTHLEWSYAPIILPASREGERVAMHYTLAWFDRYLYAGRAADATGRLLAPTLDDSADASAVGTGSWDPANGNVPHTVAGDPVRCHLSVYYASLFDFGGNEGTLSNDWAGCTNA
ncbi:MAG: hypothetical protein HYU28_04215 [Actinobacteria bacterium]|nr:hypothetical protein [Actinomycetota bacterium]